MNRRLIVRAEAEADITEAAVWYQNQQIGLGQDFVAEVDAAILGAFANPNQYARLRRKPEVRRVLTRRFPYRIFFIVHTVQCNRRISSPPHGTSRSRMEAQNPNGVNWHRNEAL